MDKYELLKEYLNTKYTYYANLGKFNVTGREAIESEVAWRFISDIMDYVDQLDVDEYNLENKVSDLKIV